MKSQGMLLPYAPAGLDKLDGKFSDKSSPPFWTGMDAWVAAVCVNTVEAGKHNLTTPGLLEGSDRPGIQGSPGDQRFPLNRHAQCILDPSGLPFSVPTIVNIKGITSDKAGLIRR